jgi:hypothetical protein
MQKLTEDAKDEQNELLSGCNYLITQLLFQPRMLHVSG